MKSSPLISVVSPVYQAEGCVEELCRRLILSLTKITEDFEIILVEDRSPDNSWMAVEAEVLKDPRVRGIRLARNFGQHRAITAGLDVANGKWVVVMDCDLQDPPESIPQLFAKAQEGYQIVIANFQERPESRVRQLISKSFWAGLSWLAGATFDPKTGNFRIMSRRVVENFRQYREQLRLLGGITALMGFTTTYLSLKRENRFSGKSSYTLKKLVSLAIDIAMAYSDKPLKLSIIAGMIISGLALTAGGTFLLLSISGLVNVPGWASVMVSLYLLGGLIIANLGVIGYYIGKTFDETKKRPLYVVEKIADATALDSQTSGVLRNTKRRLFWISGRPSERKTEVTSWLASRLRAKGIPTALLNSDEIWGSVNNDATTNYDDNNKHHQYFSAQNEQLCCVLTNQEFNVVLSSTYISSDISRLSRNSFPDYVEIYLSSLCHNVERCEIKLSNLYASSKREFDHPLALGDLTQKTLHSVWTVDFSLNKETKEILNKLENFLTTEGLI